MIDEGNLIEEGNLLALAEEVDRNLAGAVGHNILVVVAADLQRSMKK